MHEMEFASFTAQVEAKAVRVTEERLFDLNLRI